MNLRTHKHSDSSLAICLIICACDVNDLLLGMTTYRGWLGNPLLLVYAHSISSARKGWSTNIYMRLV